MSPLGLGRVKTKSDLVAMPSGRQIFAFFCSPHDVEPKIPGRLYRLEFLHSQGPNRKSRLVVTRSALPPETGHWLTN
jgi:hypothetical protein